MRCSSRTIRATAVVASLAVISLLPVAPTAAQTDVPTVNVATYGKGAGEWCMYIAQQKGYFDQAKVKIGQWLVVFGDPNIVNALVSGQVDMAVSSTGAILPVANGLTDQVVAIGGSESYPVSLVADNSITSPSQLAGKTISMPPKNTSLEIIGTRQINNLIGAGKWSAMYLGGADDTHLPLIGAGKVQAVLVNDPVTLDPDSHLHLVARLNGGQAMFNGPLMASKKFLQTNPQAAIRFLAGFAKGCNFILDPKNKAEAVNILSSATGVAHEPSEAFYDYYVAGPLRGKTPPKDARIDPAGFANTIQAMKDAGVITNKAFDPKSVIDTSYLDQALKLAATIH